MMYHKKLKFPTVDTCGFRRRVRGEGAAERATCRLLVEVLRCGEDSWCKVGRDACEACCRSFPPSAENINPVVASLLYDACSQIVTGDATGYDLPWIREVRWMAVQHLNVACQDEPTTAPSKRNVSKTLLQLVPKPPKRHGQRIRQWAVGVTTAPRREPTLQACLESLVRAGWEVPFLFMDSPVRVPHAFLDLPGTFRDQKIGAWPNYYLALMELMMRQPHADAYMIVQDDVIFFNRENVREYLEEVLWPGDSLGLVSLYCSRMDTQSKSGWHRRRGKWVAGAHAFVFAPQLAKAFVSDRSVFEHRWDADPADAKRIHDLIGDWASDHGLHVWFPTPSLAQHVGHTSTLWSTARAVGPRRADQFAGDA